MAPTIRTGFAGKPGRRGRIGTSSFPTLLTVTEAAIPVVLALNALDPAGMTGLLADTQTLAVHGCHVTGVATAYLEADSEQVFEAEAADAEQVDARIRAILEDMPVAAMSIAGLARAETVSVLAEILSDYPDLPLVLAPVLLAEEEEHEDDLLGALTDLLLPRSDLLIVSPFVARHLVQEEESAPLDLEARLTRWSSQLASLGAEDLLITGEQAATREVIHHLYHAGKLVRRDSWPRPPERIRGSDDLLAAALTAQIAHGTPLEEAVYQAGHYARYALAAAYRPGMGACTPWRLPAPPEGESAPAD